MITQFGYFDKDYKVVKTIEVDLTTINSKDPIAFAYGVAKGIATRTKSKYDRWDSRSIHGSLFSHLAPEYLRGFLLGYKQFLIPEGTRMMKGQELNFALLDKQIDPNTLTKIK